MTELPLKIWPYVCQLYGKTNVSQACLQLQDNYQFNVPLLLFCCWSARRYGALESSKLKQCLTFCDEVTAELVVPLRAVRKSMKTRYEKGWPVTEASWLTFREQIKAQELAAERMVLEGMEKLCASSDAQEGGIEDCAILLQSCFSSFQLAQGSQQVVAVLTAAFADETMHTDYFVHSIG